MHDDLNLTDKQQHELYLRERNLSAVKRANARLESTADTLREFAKRMREEFMVTGSAVGAIAQQHSWITSAVRSLLDELVEAMAAAAYPMQQAAVEAVGAKDFVEPVVRWVDRERPETSAHFERRERAKEYDKNNQDAKENSA